MITFRCTKRAAERFRLHLDDTPPTSTGILGDWYANLLNVGSQRFVLCVSERTLLPVILPARKELFPGRFGEFLRPVLEYLDIPAGLIEAELAAAEGVAFGPTRSRQVLGVMNDFAFMAHDVLGERGSTPQEATLFLAQTPSKPLGYDHPDRVARALFMGGSIA
jgi:uncharacterized protein DUF6933